MVKGGQEVAGPVGEKAFTGARYGRMVSELRRIKYRGNIVGRHVPSFGLGVVYTASISRVWGKPCCDARSRRPQIYLGAWHGGRQGRHVG